MMVYIEPFCLNSWIADSATESLMLMAENVHVAEVYDNSVNKVSEPEGIATSFTVYVTPEEVEQISLAVVYGEVQMYLVKEKNGEVINVDALVI